MTEIKMTARGNLKVNGVKFYAVPHKSTTTGKCDCPISGLGGCGRAACTPTERPEEYRLAHTNVTFVSREAYNKMKETP